MRRWQKWLLRLGVLATVSGIGAYILWRQLFAPTYHYAPYTVYRAILSENARFPRKDVEVRVWNDFQTEPFFYEVPFGLRSFMWSHWGDHVDMQIEFAGDFDPFSESAKRYAYTLEIGDRNKQLKVWYAHNAIHKQIHELAGRLAPNEVVLVRVDKDSLVEVVARGQIAFGKNVVWIRLPYRDFDPTDAYLHFSPSREVLEEFGHAFVVAPSWVRVREPWGHRMWLLDGTLLWAGTEKANSRP